MSKQNLPQKPYRIEERALAQGGYAVTFADEYDERGEALGYFHYLAHHSRTTFPEDDYRPWSTKRLVLLGPDRTVLPEVAR